MDWQNILSISGTALASLGGGAVIVFAFSNWLGKVWANRLMENEKAEHNKELEGIRTTFFRETESYKIKLKKSEFLFERQFEAASQLVALIRNLSPYRSFPDMDWEDVCEHIALQLNDLEQELDKYLSRHGAALSNEVIDKIGYCISIAGENKFTVNGFDVSDTAKTKAEELYRKLEEAEELFLKEIHNQISI